MLTKELMMQVSESFARAYAILVKELSDNFENQELLKKKVVDAPWDTWDDLPKALRDEFEKEIKKNDALLEKGEISSFHFDANGVAVISANYLKQLLAEKNISQKELAQRMHVSASHISKVLKDPTRSTVKTLQKIAKAIGVDLKLVVR